jgi:hypothetical protein
MQKLPGEYMNRQGKKRPQCLNSPLEIERFNHFVLFFLHVLRRLICSLIQFILHADLYRLPVYDTILVPIDSCSERCLRKLISDGSLLNIHKSVRYLSYNLDE